MWYFQIKVLCISIFTHAEHFYLQLSIDYNSRREGRYEWEAFAPPRTNYDVNFIQSNLYTVDKSEWAKKAKKTKTTELASERKSKHESKLRTALSKGADEENNESDEDIQRLLRKQVPVKVLPRGRPPGAQILRERNSKMSTRNIIGHRAPLIVKMRKI